MKPRRLVAGRVAAEETRQAGVVPRRHTMPPPPLPLPAAESKMELTGLESALYRMSWKLNDSTQPIMHCLVALMKEIGADDASIYLRLQKDEPVLEHWKRMTRDGHDFIPRIEGPDACRMAHEAFEGLTLLFSAKERNGAGTRYSFNMIPGDTTSSARAGHKEDKDKCVVPLFTTENGSFELKERLGVLVLKGDRLKVRGSKLKGEQAVVKTAVCVSSVARTLSGIINTSFCSTTGLQRKHEFESELSEAIRRYRVTRNNFAVLMVDLDHFKRINDQYGHDAGDAVLSSVAKTLKQNIRRSVVHAEGERRGDRKDGIDQCFRWGGEEYVVLLFNANMKDALEIAERLRRSIQSTPVEANDITLTVTASIGVADAKTVLNGEKDDYARVEDQVTKMVREADFAMYTAKNAQQGARNRIAYRLETGKFRVHSPGDEIAF